MHCIHHAAHKQMRELMILSVHHICKAKTAPKTVVHKTKAQGSRRLTKLFKPRPEREEEKEEEAQTGRLVSREIVSRAVARQ